jgi:hypothetical protein
MASMSTSEAAALFMERFGWAPSKEAPNGRVYEDWEGPEPRSVVPGAEEPADLAGWAVLWAEALGREEVALARLEATQRAYMASAAYRATREH